MFQSAYRMGQNTETALPRIHNDILLAIDDDSCVILVLLDLSADFDTVDHDILLGRLEHRFEITGKTLSWLTSYLTDRNQFDKVANEHSTGQSKASVRCTSRFGTACSYLILYVHRTPSKHNKTTWPKLSLLYMLTTRRYIFRLTQRLLENRSLSRVQSCICDITNWMTLNKLMLNSDKTELLVLNACHRPRPPLSITVGRDVIHASHTAKNIGVSFDEFPTMGKQ